MTSAQPAPFSPPPSVASTTRTSWVRPATAKPPGFLERIPVRERNQIVILPVREVASVVADGELLHLTTAGAERHTISYRLKDLEARLDPARFLRLGRGALANVDMIANV